MSEASSRRLQTGGVTVQQAFDIHQEGTQKEGTLHPWWHTKTHMQARKHTHTYTRKTCANRPRPSSTDWAHYILPTPSHHYHQGPDHTVGRRPATGGHVLAFSRVRNNNTSGLISSSTSQHPGPDISSQCYCFAWALLSCPFLSTTALRKGLHSRGVGACLDSRGPQQHSGTQRQTSNMIGQGRQRGVWQENNLTIPGALSISSSVYYTRYIRVEKKDCVYLLAAMAQEDP